MTEPKLTLEATIRRAGCYQWAEQRLFELFGQWAADLGHLEMKFLLGTQSGHHRFLAELWSARLKQLGGAASDVTPLGVVGDVLAADTWSTESVERCVVDAVRFVLPRMAATYHSHHAATNEASDGETRRVLHLTLNDYLADWPAAEFLLQQTGFPSTVVSDTQMTHNHRLRVLDFPLVGLV